MPSTTVVAIWFAGACSSARRLLAWKRWTPGPAAYRTGGENYSRGSGKVEIRYFLSSCGDDPSVLVQAIRRHWSIENGGHLDVTFREDDSRVRDRIATRNLAILRKIAIDLISRNRTPRISIRARRKQAAWNDEYMLALLTG